ncbi:uncharacterized protein [Miscanthus floridulus]|uniref:uncharacterized protein n=1 Tax=Miscanthus floridulus TaxID=154761 RepID=UPI00345AB807
MEERLGLAHLPVGFFALETTPSWSRTTAPPLAHLVHRLAAGRPPPPHRHRTAVACPPSSPVSPSPPQRVHGHLLACIAFGSFTFVFLALVPAAAAPVGSASYWGFADLRQWRPPSSPSRSSPPGHHRRCCAWQQDEPACSEANFLVPSSIPLLPSRLISAYFIPLPSNFVLARLLNRAARGLRGSAWDPFLWWCSSGWAMPAPSSAGGRVGRAATIFHEPERAGCAARLHARMVLLRQPPTGEAVTEVLLQRGDLHERLALAVVRACAGQETSANEPAASLGHHPCLSVQIKCSMKCLRGVFLNREEVIECIANQITKYN